MKHNKQNKVVAFSDLDINGSSFEANQKQIEPSSLSSRLAAYTLSILLASQPILVSAQTIIANSALTQQTNALNGVPIINIATPSAKGVSHNQFHQFNVDAQGLILNNAKSISSTQLGGYIEANPNLQSGNAASLIINEVISPNRSQLNGYTEVAGQQANVVLANPYGITCNGCGFINTPRTTLTTGTPNINNGALTGFNVNSGDIVIEGLGLNADSISQFDLITRAVTVNANLYANNLNMVLGSNQVDYDTLNATAITPSDTVAFALDSSAVGGMYANAIRLVGTEAGVGVRTLGDMATNAGDLTLSADGKISLANTQSAGNMTLHSVNDGIELTQDVHSSFTMNVTAKTNVNNAGRLSTSQNLTIQADSLNNASANSDVVAAGDVALVVNTLTNTHAKIRSEGILAITANTVNNTAGSVIQGNNVTLNVNGDITNNSSAINSLAAMTVTANTLDNNTGTIASSDDATITTNTTLSNNLGGIHADKNLSLHTLGTLNNDAGQIETHGINSSLTIDSDQITNVGGRIVNDGTGLTDLSSVSTIDNSNINNVSGGGEIGGQGDVTLTATNINTIEDAKIIAGQALVMNASNQVNNSGHIEGDTLNINATNVNNQGLILADNLHFTLTDLVNEGASGFIGATNQLSLFVSNTLSNRDGAAIYSLGDLTIAADEAQNRTESIVNSSANIEADGNISIYSNSLTNQKTLFTTELHEISRTPIAKVYFSDADRMAAWYRYWPSVNGKYRIERVWKQGNIVVSETAISQDSDRALIRAANNMDLYVTGNLTNAYSDIITGNDLTFDVGVLNNIAATKETKTQEQGSYIARIYKTRSGDCNEAYSADIYSWCNASASLNEQSSTYGALTGGEALFSGNKTLTGSAWTINNTNQGGSTDGVTLAVNQELSITPFSFSLPDSSLYTLKPAPSSHYLVETAPRFADFGQFISSDYMLQQLHLDPELIPKRLGDGFYEQRLVLDQLRQQTGQQYLNGIDNGKAQYTDLMDAGINAAQTLNLTPYVALTKAQISALTKTIVWLENDTVTLADGSTTTVLVPKVYLARSQDTILTNGGAIMAADKVQLAIGDALTNSGKIFSQDSTVIAANDINNLSGTLASQGDITLTAQNNITNTSGTISGNNLSLTAGNTITNSTDVGRFGATTRAANARGSINADNDLSLTAGKNITIQGADVTANNTIALDAENVTITTTQADNVDGYEHTTTHQQSTVTAGNTLDVAATNDITVTGSALTADQGISLNAGNTININAAKNTRDINYVAKSILTVKDTTHQGSSLSSNKNITLQAGNDLNIIGSNVTAKHDINLQAQGDTTIASVQDEAYFYSYVKVKKSWGRSKTTTIEQESKRNIASSLNAGGNVLINTQKSETGITSTAVAGDVNLIGSNITAGQDIALYAGDNLTATTSTDYDYNRVEVSKKGLLGTGSNYKSISQQQRQQQAQVKSGDSVELTAGNNLTLIAPKISGENDITLTSDTGTITLASATDTDYQHQEYSKTGGFSWQSGNEGHQDQSVRHTEITTNGDIHIQAANGLVVEYKQNGKLNESIDSLSQLPELAWMKAIQQRDDIDWQAIQEAHDQWQQHDSGLGGPGFTLVAIAVAIATSGTGAALVGETAVGTTATAAGVAQAAVLDTLINQATVSLIVNKGDIGAVFKDIISKEGLISLATAGATAGITNSLFDSLDISNEALGITADAQSITNPLVESAKGLTLGQQLQRNIVRAAVGSTVNTVAYGGEFEQNLFTAAANATVNTIAADLTRDIGDLQASSDGAITEGGLTKIIAHATVGCAAQSLTGGNCSAGALGAATAELLAPHLTGAELGKVSSELTVVFANGLAALVTGEDLEQTINAGLQVERFNRQLHHVDAVALKKLIDEHPELKEGDLQAIACAEVKCAAQVNEADPNYTQVRALQDNGEKLLASNSAETQVWQAFKAEQPELFTYTETNRTLDALYKHEQGVAIANNGAQLAVGSVGTVAGLGLCETTGIGCVLGVPLAGVSYASALQANNNLKSIYDGHYTYSNGALSLASFNPDNFPYIQEEVIPGTVGNWAATSTQTIPGHFAEDLPNPTTDNLTGLAWSVADIVPIGYIVQTGRLIKQAAGYEGKVVGTTQGGIVVPNNQIGSTFEGGLYRSVPEGRNPLEIHPIFNTEKAIHRYTGEGQGGLYLGSSQRIVNSEFTGNGASIEGLVNNRYDVKIDGLLDLTNPSVRSELGVSLEDLVRTGGSKEWRYEITNPLGKYAESSGYNGIIAPAAQADGGINVILFNPGLVK